MEATTMIALLITSVSYSRRPLVVALLLAFAGLGVLQVQSAHAETAGVIYVVDAEGGSGRIIRVDPSKPDGSNQTVVSAGQNLERPTIGG